MAKIELETDELGTLLSRLGHAESRVQEFLDREGQWVEKYRAKLGINELCRTAHSMAKDKGWYDDEARPVPELIALIHSEASEALEAYRDGDMETTVLDSGKPVGFPTEAADMVIRIADMCEYLGIDLEAEIRRKMAFNATRPRRHGGKAA